ncbi:MAG: hybrid sensor histidine kinase/response regulator [Campylobacteraceae bacterium]|nr:hybrid sensor histidine kinase/response regulator [Campylobacteraceae bacterium]
MKKFSILLVDDVEQNIHSLKLMIEDNFDVAIFTALGAQEGMAILMKEDIHLILTDVQMPDIDGFEFAEYLRGIERTKHIPLVFITGIYDKEEYQKRGYDLGAIEYITKPIDDVLLNAKLKIYIDLFQKQRQQKEELITKNEVLIHQAKMATMGEMLGVISHQMKQPLNVLSLYCGDVKDSYKYNEINDEFIDDFSQKTKEQIEFLNKTIDGFRDFFDPHKLKKQFLLKDAIDKSLSLIAFQLQLDSIEVNIHIKEEKVFGIITELEQVILNLLTNAKDAFIENNIQNRIISINAYEDENNTILSIEDNAGGIKEENLELIFDPYFTTKKEGTGTGLYMVKLVVKTSFNGKLELKNSKDGVKFIISLPKQI